MKQELYITPNPFDNLLLTSEEGGLTGISFYPSTKIDDGKRNPSFSIIRKWLDEYFAGLNPSWRPQYQYKAHSKFQKEVSDILLSIPYGMTITYGKIAATIAENRGMKRMSSQAVGGALRNNPLVILLPCHRVIGANGEMVGFHGGVKNKIALLALEKAVLL